MQKTDLSVDLEIYFIDGSAEREYMGTVTIQTDSRFFYNHFSGGTFKNNSVCEYATQPIRIDDGRIELRVRTRPIKPIDRVKDDGDSSSL